MYPHDDTVTIESEGLTEMDFEGLAQDVLVDCTGLDEPAMYAAARAISQGAYVRRSSYEHSIRKVAGFTASLLQMAVVNPTSNMDQDTQVGFLRRSRAYIQRVVEGYEWSRDEFFPAAEVMGAFRKRVVGGFTMHLERLERPWLAPESRNHDFGKLLIAATSLYKARFVNRAKRRELERLVVRAEKYARHSKEEPLYIDSQ